MRPEILTLVETIFRQEDITTERVSRDQATLVVIRLNMAGYRLLKEDDVAGKTARGIAKKIDPNWLAKALRWFTGGKGR